MPFPFFYIATTQKGQKVNKSLTKMTHVKAFYVLLILSTGTKLFSDVDDNFWNILKNAGVKEYF